MDRLTRRGAIALGAAAGLSATALTGTANAAQTPKFAPLPQQAKPRPLPPEGYILDRIGDRMYAVTAGGNQSAFVVTNSGVVLLDAPPSLASFLPAAIRKVTDKRVTHLVYSHSHADHTAGSAAFGDIIRIGHAETARILKADRDPNRPLPSVTFTDKYSLHVGGQHIQLSYHGPNHESGNILMHIPQQRAAMMADLVLPGWSPFRAWGTADSVPGVLRAHDVLAGLDIETYVGGHVHRLGTPRDIKDSRDFVYDLWHTTSAAIGSINAGDYFAAVEAGNNWAGFRLYLEAIADQVAPQLIQRWTGKLAAVDVWTHENAMTVALSQMVDAPKDLR